MCLRVEGTLHQSQIHLWALEPLLTLACMDGVLKHPVQAKWHIQRILPGRPQYFLGKAYGRKQTVQRREERNIHCAFPSSSAPNTSATIVTIHTVLLHPEVFISVYLRYLSGLYRRSPEFSWNRMKLRLCYSCLVYRNKSKNQNIVCEFIAQVTMKEGARCCFATEMIAHYFAITFVFSTDWEVMDKTSVSAFRKFAEFENLAVGGRGRTRRTKNLFWLSTENHYGKTTVECNNLIKSIFVKMTALWVRLLRRIYM